MEAYILISIDFRLWGEVILPLKESGYMCELSLFKFVRLPTTNTESHRWHLYHKLELPGHANTVAI